MSSASRGSYTEFDGIWGSSSADVWAVGGATILHGTSGVAGAPTTVTLNDGNNQIGLTASALAVKPSVTVTDANGYAVAGVAVNFVVAAGAGTLAGPATVITGSDGVATVGGWILGVIPRYDTLTATAAGLSGSPVTFVATGTALNWSSVLSGTTQDIDDVWGSSASEGIANSA